MIIPALVKYYNHLIEIGDTKTPNIGYQFRTVDFVVVLAADGTAKISNLNTSDRSGVEMPIPADSKWMSRTANTYPGFLCDTAEYLLGLAENDTDKSKNRASKRRACFLQRHVDSDLDDEGFVAVRNFLQSSDAFTGLDISSINSRSIGIFRLQGHDEYIHERNRVVAYWKEASRFFDGARLLSLIDGHSCDIARIHGPAIRGVALKGTDPLPKIVSFDLENDAWCSFGKIQGDNAPMDSEDVFKYCSALNRLSRDKNRRVRIGDTTIVFWAEQSSPFECSILPAFMTGGGGEDSGTISELRSTFQSLRQGRKVNDIDPSTPFYVLGLAPNAARLSIRFWITGTIADFAERMDTHLADLELEPAPDDLADLSIRRLIGETVPPRDGWADEGAISPVLAGAVLRAILTGGPYPRSLLSAVINRVRIEGLVYGKDKRKDYQQAAHRRCAIIKACLQRNARIAGHEKEIPVSLNPKHPETAYQLGRLFAVLEKIQHEANNGKDIGRTIKDSYFGASCSTPGAIIPRLLQRTNHHLKKLGSEKPGLRISREIEIQEILDNVDSEKGYPKMLDMEGQGLFTLGYYHQRKFLFTKKEDRPTEEPANA